MPKRRVTDDQILEALANKGADDTNTTLALKLGISQPAFSKRLRKLTTRVIPEFVKHEVRKIAIEQINNLKRNAKAGDTNACKILLEMSGMYTQKQEIATTVQAGVIQMPTKVPVGTVITTEEANGSQGMRIANGDEAVPIKETGIHRENKEVIIPEPEAIKE